VRLGGVLASVAALLAVLLGGIWLGGHPAKLPEFVREHLVDDSAGLNVEATELIEANYFRKVGSHELTDGSLQGMVRALRRRHHDRFSDYFSPQLQQRFDEELSGHFSGIGLTVTEVPAGLRVTRVFSRSPADRAGIAVGDLIVSVEGSSIEGEDSEESTQEIKGPEGTEVRVGVKRPPHGKPRELRITRAQITLPVVESRLIASGRRKLGYVGMHSFSEGVHAFLRHAVRKVAREGAEGIVLDLRGNGGGLLQEAVLSASVFLPEDRVVVTTRSRTQGNAVYKTVGGNLPSRPLVVLIDRNTASAAEILTAALVDDAGAKTVGTRSYGKGVFQQEMGLSNGGALKLTVGEYFTPDGVNLARSHGIHPDLRAPNLPATPRDETLDRALGALASED
jgi:carboxyl-terminal processing protease